MKLADIPPEKARDFIRAFLDRNKDREDGRPFKTILHMTRDEALMFWAAEKWLGNYREWGVGLELTAITIDDARKYLGEQVAELKAQTGAEEMKLTITERGRRFLAAAEHHLDRYVIHRSIPDKPKSYSGSRKR